MSGERSDETSIGGNSRVLSLPDGRGGRRAGDDRVDRTGCHGPKRESRRGAGQDRAVGSSRACRCPLVQAAGLSRSDRHRRERSREGRCGFTGRGPPVEGLARGQRYARDPLSRARREHAHQRRYTSPRAADRRQRLLGRRPDIPRYPAIEAAAAPCHPLGSLGDGAGCERRVQLRRWRC